MTRAMLAAMLVKLSVPQAVQTGKDFVLVQ